MIRKSENLNINEEEKNKKIEKTRKEKVKIF